jgi:hypothetical protein
MILIQSNVSGSLAGPSRGYNIIRISPHTDGIRPIRARIEFDRGSDPDELRFGLNYRAWIGRTRLCIDIVGQNGIAEMFETQTERQNFLRFSSGRRWLQARVGRRQRRYSLRFHLPLTAAQIAFVDCRGIGRPFRGRPPRGRRWLIRCMRLRAWPTVSGIFVNRGPQSPDRQRLTAATIFYDRIVRAVGLAEGSSQSEGSGSRVLIGLARTAAISHDWTALTSSRSICTSKKFATAGQCFWEAFVALSCEWRSSRQKALSLPMNTGVL